MVPPNLGIWFQMLPFQLGVRFNMVLGFFVVSVLQKKSHKKKLYRVPHIGQLTRLSKYNIIAIQLFVSVIRDKLDKAWSF